VIKRVDAVLDRITEIIGAIESIEAFGIQGNIGANAIITGIRSTRDTVFAVVGNPTATDAVA
jgi:hypothetical protein